MNMFLGFITVDVEEIRDHLDYSNGWTRYENKDNALIIRGGVYGGVEYLDSIQFGEKLHNRYNNYVNPFYIFDILNEEGKVFFVDYFKAEILAIVESNREGIIFLEKKMAEQKAIFANIQLEVEKLNLHNSITD